MKSYIPLDTIAIFSLANLSLKQAISSDLVMVDFICMSLLDLWGTRPENYKIKHSCPPWDFNPGPSTYEANALSVELIINRADKYRSPKGDKVLLEYSMLVGWLWFNVTFSDISAIKWRDSCPVLKILTCCRAPNAMGIWLPCHQRVHTRWG